MPVNLSKSSDPMCVDLSMRRRRLPDWPSPTRVARPASRPCTAWAGQCTRQRQGRAIQGRGLGGQAVGLWSLDCWERLRGSADRVSDTLLPSIRILTMQSTTWRRGACSSALVSPKSYASKRRAPSQISRRMRSLTSCNAISFTLAAAVDKGN